MSNEDAKEEQYIELAIHMRNRTTGEERIKKTKGKSAAPGEWKCKDFYYKSEWEWIGTGPWKNIKDQVEHIGRGYYKKRQSG